MDPLEGWWFSALCFDIFLFMMLYCNVLMWSLIVQKFDECQRPWCKAGLRPLQACESSCMNACMPTCLAIYISFIFIYHAFLEVRCLHNGGRLRRNRRRGKNIKWMKKNQKQTVQNRAFHAWTNYYKKILFCFLICMHAWVCLLGVDLATPHGDRNREHDLDYIMMDALLESFDTGVSWMSFIHACIL